MAVCLLQKIIVHDEPNIFLVDGAGPYAHRGTPRCLEAVAAEYGADEVIVVTVTHSHAARGRSYELIADAFGLGPAVPPVGAYS